MILDAFKNEMLNYTAEQLTVVRGQYDPITGKIGNNVETWTEIGNCLFWRGAQAERLVSDTIREQVDVVAIFNPDVYLSNEKLKINGTIYEMVADPDDAYDNEIVLVPLKELA